MKFYSVDELLQHIGGMQSVFLIGLGFFMTHYAEVSFIISHSSAYDRIKYQIGYTLDHTDKKLRKKFLKLRNKLNLALLVKQELTKSFWRIYLSDLTGIHVGWIFKRLQRMWDLRHVKTENCDSLSHHSHSSDEGDCEPCIDKYKSQVDYYRSEREKVQNMSCLTNIRLRI